MTWCVLGLLVVVIAGFDGGPKSVDDWCLSRIFGAEPNPENPTQPMLKCNGIGLGRHDCPTVGRISCGDGHYKPLSADSGGINNKRYDRDPDKPACRPSNLNGCPGDLFDYELTTTACIPQQVP